jgi:hypothetical protein
LDGSRSGFPAIQANWRKFGLRKEQFKSDAMKIREKKLKDKLNNGIELKL